MKFFFLSALLVFPATSFLFAETLPTPQPRSERYNKRHAEESDSNAKSGDGLEGLMDLLDVDNIDGEDRAKLLKKLVSGKSGKNSPLKRIKGKSKGEMYRESLETLMEKADEALAEKNYDDASFMYRLVLTARVSGISEIKKKASEKLAEIEQIAKDKLIEASDLIVKRKRKEAARILQFITLSLKDTKAAPKARRKLAVLLKDPKIAANFEYVNAQKLDDSGDLLNAVKLYTEIQKKYPDTVESLKATKRLNIIRTDPKLSSRYNTLMETYARKAAPKQLSLARQYLKNAENTLDDSRRAKLQAEARRRAKKIIQDFPNTSYARDAQKILERLPPK